MTICPTSEHFFYAADRFLFFIILLVLLLLLFIYFDDFFTQKIVSNTLRGIAPAETTSTITTNYTHNVKKATESECTYEKDITVYMDAFEELSKYLFGSSYQGFISKSRKCKPLPGGGRCSFNHDNKSSDAIFYCGAYTNLKYKRVFSGQIVVVFTMESEKGHNCHFPPSDQYDIKVSYRRDSTVPLPFLCNADLALKVARMGPPDVPVGRKNLVASFISGCKHKWRNDYLIELMKYIQVDQWGRCLKNTPGDFWKTRQKSFSNEKLNFLKKTPYKFLISFENNVEDDYVTEKVYHGYLTRTIPIYYGDRAVFDLVPANSSLIFANNYRPKELAELIQHIANNDSLYSQYFANWDLSKMRKLHKQYCSEHFTCTACRKVWNILYNRKCIIKK